jgi:hypothetical protein
LSRHRQQEHLPDAVTLRKLQLAKVNERRALSIHIDMPLQKRPSR